MESLSNSTSSQGLGHLAILPFDIRRLVWSQFIPTGRDHAPMKKTDLRALRASKAVYQEISAVLYPPTTLHLDVLPTYTAEDDGLPDPWCVVRFENRCCPYEQALWVLRDDGAEEGGRFNRFPFHKVRSLRVNLYAPDPSKEMELISLWRNAIRIFRLLKEPVSLPPFTIHLEKNEDHDWFRPGDALCTRYKPIPQPGSRLTLKRDQYFCHDMLIIPFCFLRNLPKFDVKAHSEELENKMDWTVTNWAKGLVANKPDGYYTDLEERTGEDYIWMEICVDWGKRTWLREEVIKFIDVCGCNHFLSRVNSFMCLACMSLSDEDDLDQDESEPEPDHEPGPIGESEPGVGSGNALQP